MALEEEGRQRRMFCCVQKGESNFRPLSIRASHPRNVGQIRRVFASATRVERRGEMMEQVLMEPDCRGGAKGNKYGTSDRHTDWKQVLGGC